MATDTTTQEKCGRAIGRPINFMTAPTEGATMFGIGFLDTDDEGVVLGETAIEVRPNQDGTLDVRVTSMRYSEAE